MRESDHERICAYMQVERLCVGIYLLVSLPPSHPPKLPSYLPPSLPPPLPPSFSLHTPHPPCPPPLAVSPFSLRLLLFLPHIPFFPPSPSLHPSNSVSLPFILHASPSISSSLPRSQTLRPSLSLPSHLLPSLPPFILSKYNEMNLSM